MAKAIINGVEINKFVVDGGGSGDCDLDFTQIGYEGTPQSMIDAIEYAKEIQANWDGSKNTSYSFSGDTKLVYFPKVDTSVIINMYGYFQQCKNLEYIPNNLVIANVTNMGAVFDGCSSLVELDLSSWDVSATITMRGMFMGCKKLKRINITNWNTSTVNNWGADASFTETFRNNEALERVDGYFDYSSTQRNYNYSSYAFSGCTNLRRFEARNMGKNQSSDYMTFKGGTPANMPWGVNTDDVPDARESMINTLITYSYDRASAGYSNCNLLLSTLTKEELTDSEIAQITSKGYTIA